MKRLSQNLPLNIIALLTAIIGVVTLSSILYAVVHLREAKIVIADAHLTVIAGLSLIYLAMLIRRGKQNAWAISLVVYLFILFRNLRHFVFDDDLSKHYLLLVSFNLVLPVVLFAALIIYRRRFRVKSEASSFRIALRRALIILAVAFLYGVVGFQLFDHKDFHKEISPRTAAHYTIDQFGLTTSNQPFTQSRRAVFFVDSLATISVASLAYVALALFAPIKFRLQHGRQDFVDAWGLVNRYPKSSEDYFKLWPRDKAYFFNSARTSMVAYRVQGGVALSVGDPLGKPTEVKELCQDFLEFCQINDWRPAFIHTDSSNLKMYQKQSLDYQKIGEEAIVSTDHFVSEVIRNKYFRNINNRFTKAGYSFEILEPPHSQQLIAKLQKISNDWLQVPGRAERGFMLGYFTPEYIGQCRVAVAKTPQGHIQAFLNQVPTCKPGEANYDFLRHASGSLPNINDFLMLNFIKQLHQEGYNSLNMGLCPLSGLDSPTDESKNLVDSILRFAYTNGSRFYSFDGLKRFKSKFEPTWEDRYIVYAGGVTGFGRTLNALLRAMTKVPKRSAKRP